MPVVPEKADSTEKNISAGGKLPSTAVHRVLGHIERLQLQQKYPDTLDCVQLTVDSQQSVQ